MRTVTAVQEAQIDLADAVPTNLISIEPSICACGDTRLSNFTKTHTPVVYGTELISGKLRQTFPITGFPTRMLGFYLGLSYASLIDYNGYVGLNFSHSYNAGSFGIVAATGQIQVGDGTNLDYEGEKNTYGVEVTATDPSGASDMITVTITSPTWRRWVR